MPSNEYALLIFMDILLLQEIVKINMPKNFIFNSKKCRHQFKTMNLFPKHHPYVSKT